VVGGGDERVEEHQGEARKLVTGFAGREGGRKGELRGDLERGGANGGGGDSGRREGARPGAEQGGEGRGGRGHACKAMGGRRAGQRVGCEKAGSARLCRGGSASNLGVRARKRRRVAKPRSIGKEPWMGRTARGRRGRRVAVGLDSSQSRGG